VVVDARGDMRSGVFGNMMLTYLKGKGGAGIVVDGCIRDFPIALAGELHEKALHHAEWEEFSRGKLGQGGDLRKYYPLSQAGWKEYVAWCKAQGRPHPGDRPVPGAPPEAVARK